MTSYHAGNHLAGISWPYEQIMGQYAIGHEAVDGGPRYRYSTRSSWPIGSFATGYEHVKQLPPDSDRYVD